MIAFTASLALATLPFVLGDIFVVQVGPNGLLAYDPPFVNANPGDTINFTFNPKNHTVTQSSFGTPCVALDEGAKTGFVPVAAGAVPVVKQFTVPEGTAPLWFYCGQTGHCEAGMVFAINPPADPSPNSFSAFKALAMGSNASASAVAPPASSVTGTASSVYVTPPAPVWQSATATVTFDGSVYTTTYASYQGTPPPTPAAVPMDHKITVGANSQLSYDPPSIQASIGDTVTFEFHPKNHTVTQSSFLNPCQSLLETTGTAGFKSGFEPVTADATVFPTFQITINDTVPIWGYCGQTGHCQAGMVFAINAVESGPNNFNAFQQLAMNTPNATTTSGSGSSGTPASTATISSTSSKASSAALSIGASLSLPFALTFSGFVALML